MGNKKATRYRLVLGHQGHRQLFTTTDMQAEQARTALKQLKAKFSQLDGYRVTIYGVQERIAWEAGDDALQPSVHDNQ